MKNLNADRLKCWRIDMLMVLGVEEIKGWKIKEFDEIKCWRIDMLKNWNAEEI